MPFITDANGEFRAMDVVSLVYELIIKLVDGLAQCEFKVLCRSLLEPVGFHLSILYCGILQSFSSAAFHLWWLSQLIFSFCLWSALHRT